ncbi:MAG: MFS transporter [Hyphomicrobiales bacterium]|nr:MFS transporter [Hyphomicrobiales bacterium]MDE2114882.1 MFS transporter [Hyphomicrobiales bacterium]
MITRANALVLGAAIVAISLVGMGLSLIIPVLSLRMQAAGYSAGNIGLNTAVGALATLFLAPFVPRLAARFGARRLMLAALALAIFCMFAFGLVTNIAWWFPLRLMFGGALTILFVMSEYWINAAAPADKRGMIMGIYATSLALGFSLGPAALYVTGTASLWPFGLAAMLYAISAIPVMLAGGEVPEIVGASRIPLWHILIGTPVASLAALTFGIVETGSMSLLPVYAVAQHFTAQQGALCVSLFAFGSLIFEIPVGILSDRMDRRHLLLAIAVGGALGALLAPFLGAGFLPFAMLLVMWGGLVGALYPLALAHLGARYTGAELANANTAVVMFYSLGMLAGPPFLGAAMDWLAPRGLFFGLAAVLAAYALVVIWRLHRQGRARPI